MNWATERAREVLNSVGFREDSEAAIAAALQAVADDALAVVEANSRWKVAEFLRARFPKEGE